MKLKVLLAVCGLCISVTAFAGDDKPTLKDSVSVDVKAAIKAAQTVNGTAKKAGFEWIWALPQRGLWEGELMTSSDILDQAIVKANTGKSEEAKKAAAFVEMAAQEGIQQAERAKSAGPEF